MSIFNRVSGYVYGGIIETVGDLEISIDNHIKDRLFKRGEGVQITFDNIFCHFDTFKFFRGILVIGLIKSPDFSYKDENGDYQFNDHSDIVKVEEVKKELRSFIKKHGEDSSVEVAYNGERRYIEDYQSYYFSVKYSGSGWY